MQLHIKPHDEAPVYRQIHQQLARAIADREIHPGDLLQSQQELAVRLAVSLTAVRRAYQELQSNVFDTRRRLDRGAPGVPRALRKIVCRS